MDEAGHRPENQPKETKVLKSQGGDNWQKVAKYVSSDLENIFLVDETESRVCSLQVIQCLPHITISSENDCFKAFRNIRNLQWL